MSSFALRVCVLLAVFCSWQLCQADPTRPSQARQEIADSFVASVEKDGMLPLAIPASPSIHVSPISSPGANTAGASFVIGPNRAIVCEYFSPQLKLGSVLALHGKLFEVANISSAPNDRSPQRNVSEISFRVTKNSKLLARISKDGDTYFLPVDGRVYVGSKYFTISAMLPQASNGVAVRVLFPRESDNANDSQANNVHEQVVTVGEVIRYGKRGLKVRSIVMPDQSQNMVGWVEVFAEEVSFAD